MNWHEKANFFTFRGSKEYNDEDNDFSGDGESEGKNDGEGEGGDDDNYDGTDGYNMFSDDDEFSVDFGDLMWRVEKARLEEANTRRFLKAKPRFLPYDECRNWVKAWNRWDTKEEWEEWINEGEKRNSYIPSRPDEYYGSLGEWKGWDHFLGKD